MAAPPSVSTLSSSVEAFKYPLPTVRQLHKQLGTALDEKNARLRTLVGGSYRQLLGTAETIMEMRRDIEIVERKLERVIDGCGKTIVGRKVSGLGKLDDGHVANFDPDQADQADLGQYARMKVVENCVMVAGRLLKGGQANKTGQAQSLGAKLTTAAKVLVLSRLLLKSLGVDISNLNSAAAGLVKELQKKVGILRRRLLRRIEHVLQRVGDHRDDMVKAMSAYSIATSSGAKDNLRHFLHVRGEAMTLAFEDKESTEHLSSDEHIVKALKLFTGTLLDVQALAPRRLSEALLHQKTEPLLKDASVNELEGLRLDLCQRWFGDELFYFTPFIRHDDLESPLVAEMLKGWAKGGSAILLKGFQRTLERSKDVKAVVSLRTRVLELWIRDGGKARNFDPSVLLDELRGAVNDRLVSLIEGRVNKLRLVGTEIEAALASSSFLTDVKSLDRWAEEYLSMELSKGGSQFRQAVLHANHGQTDAVSRVLNSYETWRHLIDELFEVIGQLQTQRWNDDLEALDDDLSLEDRDTLLRVDDPSMLLKRLDRGLKQAFYELHDKLSTLSTTYRESEHTGAVCIMLLRIIREIRTRLPKATDVQSFGLSLVPELHRALAPSVSSEALNLFGKSLKHKRKLVGRALWEGDLPLPVYPSPPIFKLLHNLTSAMSAAGSDLWSPGALAVLKQSLSSRIAEIWQEALDELISGGKGGEPEARQEPVPSDLDDGKAESEAVEDSPANESATESLRMAEILRRDKVTQWTFDILVLKHCLNLTDRSHSTPSLETVMDAFKPHAGMADAATQRVELAAEEYWRRTNLLFGLLA